MSWIDEQEKKHSEVQSDGYFNIQEGDNRIQLLTHCAPLAQVWNAIEKRYVVAEDGDTNVSIKGVCWVFQDGKIKQAKLPYTVVKAIRELQNDEDYAFESFPMPRQINIKAKGAGTKEVEYTVVPSPKETPVSKEVLEDLKKKPTPEEVIEKIKGKATPSVSHAKTMDNVRDGAEEDRPEGEPPF